VPDSGYAKFQPGILGRQIELEVAVFLRVWRKLVGADRYRAPLESLADIPNRLLAGPPCREMIELPPQRAKPLPANPLEAALVRRVAIDASEVELSDLAQRERLPALVRRLARSTRHIDIDRRAVSEVAQIGGERGVLIARGIWTNLFGGSKKNSEENSEK
jgi:hypothetical protein